MTAAVFDFPTIAKHARLKALDGTPQNVVQPMVVTAGPDPVEFDGYGMYAGWAAIGMTPAEIGEAVRLSEADTAPCEVNPAPEWHTLTAPEPVSHTHSLGYDERAVTGEFYTVSTFDPPEQDGA